MTRAARILIVDDRPENLLALEALLEPIGCVVHRASSGKEALKLLLLNNYALILLDVQMPGMDGYETAEYIQTLDRTRRVPIIFLTALSKDEGHVFRGYRAGAVDYVIKPYDPHNLLAKATVFVDLYEQGLEVRESEARHKAALENAPMGVAIVDGEGRWVRLNRAFGAILETAPERLVGQLWPDAGATSVTDGETEVERTWLRAGGDPCVLIVRTAPVGDGSRNIVVMAIDMTARRRAEEAAASIERSVGERATQEKLDAQTRRWQQALLPALPEDLHVRTFYRPGDRLLPGGDFYDALRSPEGALEVVLGEVSGDGPETTAVAASLRVAWRALTLSGQALERVVSGMQDVLRAERRDDGIIATICCARFAPDGTSVTALVAGHPAPIILAATARAFELPVGPPIGALDVWDWRAGSARLTSSDAVMLYGDALADDSGAEPNPSTHLLGLLAQRDMTTADAVPTLVEEIAVGRGGLPDPVAVLIVKVPPPRAPHAGRRRAAGKAG